MASYTWIGDDDGFFGDQSNWFNTTDGMADDGFPGPGDTAFVNTTGTVTVDGDTVANLNAFDTNIDGDIDVTGTLIGGDLTGGDNIVGTAESTIFEGLSLTANILEQCNLDDGVVTTDLWFAGAVGGATVTATTIERDPSGVYNSFCYVVVNSGSLTAATMTLIGPTKQLKFSDSFLINGGTATITGAASATGNGTVVESDGGTLKFDRALTIYDGAEFYAAKGGNTTIDNLIVAKSGNDLVEIQDPGTTVTVTGEFVLGEDGKAQLEISDDAVLNVDGAFVMGQQEGSVVTMTVGDAGATVNLHDEWRIGIAGMATVQLNGGITVNALDGIQLGVQTTGVGTLNLTGDTTLVSVTGDVTIGVAGTGTLLVRAGATFDAAASDVTLADEATANATLTVTGDGSLLQAGSLTVGGAGTATPTGAPPKYGAEATLGAEIDVTNDLTIGDEASGKGRLLIGDPGSDLEVGGDATLGESGAGTLTISGGDATIGGDATLGESGAGALTMSGGDATIDGDMTLGEEENSTGRLIVNSASLEVLGKLTIGEAGMGAALVQLGSSLDAGDIEIGGVLGASGSLKLDGATTAATTGELTIGAGGTGTLSITNGASLTTNEEATIGSVALGAIVSASLDTGGSWLASNSLTVGDNGAGKLSITGQNTSLEVDAVMTIGANAGGTVTLGTNTAASAASLLWGRSLIVGEQAKGTLTINAGDSASAIAGAVGALYIATEAGSSGTVSVVGAGAQLTGGSLEVGGTAAAAGGAGTLAVGAGAEASFAGATVWNTGKITDAGTLTLGGVVHGTGNLLIESGGTLTLKRSDASARPVFVAGAEAETLDLVAGQLPAAHIAGFAASDLVSISGLATSDTIATTYASNTAIVDFLALGKVVGHLDFAMSAGQHDVFQFNAATGALTLAPSS